MDMVRLTERETKILNRLKPVLERMQSMWDEGKEFIVLLPPDAFPTAKTLYGCKVQHSKIIDQDMMYLLPVGDEYKWSTTKPSSNFQERVPQRSTTTSSDVTISWSAYVKDSPLKRRLRG
jgi:hypothetical protein